jgi:hypothetical protein
MTKYPRTASRTSSFASATSHATTTPRRHRQRRMSFRSGNFTGARSRWVSRPATSSSYLCGRNLATCQSEKVRNVLRAQDLRSRRVCKCHYKVLGRGTEVHMSEECGLHVKIFGSSYLCCAIQCTSCNADSNSTSTVDDSTCARTY